MSRVLKAISRLVYDGRPLVTVVDFKGVIGGAGLPRPGSINVDQAEKWLRLAFNPNLGQKAVALAFDCPGGSPAATELLHRSIRRHAEESKLPVYAFAQGVAASGGYWAMCAADELYALNTSVVGSVGVLMSGFGVTEALKKVGVERRLLTAGKLKGLMDPFKELAPEEEAITRELLADLHASFKEVVLDSRKGKLRAVHEELFSGRVWTGRRAVELGLMDGVADVQSLMKQKFGDQVRLQTVNPQHRGAFFTRFIGGQEALHGAGYSFGAAAAAALLDSVEQRAAFGSNLH